MNSQRASKFICSNENMLQSTLYLWMTSVAHMDSPKIIDHGLSQILSKLVDNKLASEMDVHLIGGYEDAPYENSERAGSQRNSKQNGHSFPLCAKLVEALRKSAVKFHIQTLFVLNHNTKKDTTGNKVPIFTGFLVETRTGAIIPATFNRSTRCPDEIVRRIRLSASFTDPHWRNKLLETYDTDTDRFIIAPCSWNMRLVQMAVYLQQFPDSEVLPTCSTSPFAEAPDFIDNQRRQWDYLIQYPNWKDTFRMGEPRVFTRTSDGGWAMVEPAQEAAH